jgi:hypothetical protein
MAAVLILVGVPMAFAIGAVVQMATASTLAAVLGGSLIAGMLILLYGLVRFVRGLEARS